jgi:1-deoxy-D-xylulose-5-phosphate synthase
MGSLLAEAITDNNSNNKLVKLGIPDQFIAHGTQAELYKECGFDAEGIYSTVLNFFK